MAKHGVGPQKADVQGPQLLQWRQQDRRPLLPAPPSLLLQKPRGMGEAWSSGPAQTLGCLFVWPGQCPKGCRAPSTAARVQAVPLGQRLQEGGARQEKRGFSLPGPRGASRPAQDPHSQVTRCQNLQTREQGGALRVTTGLWRLY